MALTIVPATRKAMGRTKMPRAREMAPRTSTKAASQVQKSAEKFNWMWHYYFLTNEGIEYLREYLNLPATVFPSTLTKQRPSHPQLGGGDQGGGDGERGWGKD